MQLTVGNEEEQYPLQKHGGEHESQHCRKWLLQADDYIRHVIFSWSDFTNQFTQIVFQTNEGKSRVVGWEEPNSRRTIFEYDETNPLMGFFSYENGNETWAIGAYEDRCILPIEEE